MMAMARRTTTSMTIATVRGATGDEVDDDVDGAKLSPPSMRRRVRCRRNSVVALVVMASLPSPMHRRLAIVDDDGDGVTGDVDYNDVDDATDFAVVAMASLPLPMHRRLAVVNDDGDGATGDKVNDDGDGATGDDVDDDGEGATYDDIDDDCDSATGDDVDDDCDGATGEEVDDDGDGATGYDDDDDDDVHRR